MNIGKWLSENTTSLEGKTAAITGATGGIGCELCRYLAGLGASLILLDRNESKSSALCEKLISEFPSLSVRTIVTDLEDIASVKRTADELKALPVDFLIHNAGAYSIPRHKTSAGFDNVYQINFASPYYLTRELLPHLRERRGRVVAVGSVAHRYSETDMNDADFSTRKAASLVYGNAKRQLMFALYSLFEDEDKASLAVAHPGITFTNITAHYPPIIFAIIKNPMKIIFPKPKVASLSILRGLFLETKYCEWIGPRIFDVWGKPKKSLLRSCGEDEISRIADNAERVYGILRRC